MYNNLSQPKKKKLINNLKKESDSNMFLRQLIRVTVDYPTEIISILNQVTEQLSLPIWYMYLSCLAQLDMIDSAILPNVLSVAPVMPPNFLEDITED